MVNLMMPQYRCHKIVGALQIKAIDVGQDGVVLHFYEERYRPIALKNADIARYRPQVDDYLVQYSSEYISVSPRAAFEDGYSLV